MSLWKWVLGMGIVTLAGLNAAPLGAMEGSKNRTRTKPTLEQELQKSRNKAIRNNLERYVHPDLHNTALEVLQGLPTTAHDKAFYIRAHAGPNADQFGPEVEITAGTKTEYEKSLREYVKQYTDQ